MPQETLLSKILSGLKRRGRKPQSRRKKIRLPFSGKIKAIASKLINSKIPDLEKLAPVEEHQITKPSFGVVAKNNPEYIAPAVKPKTNPKHIISVTKPRDNSEYTIPSGKVFSKAFSRFEILMKKLNKSGKRFIPISRDDVNVLTKIIPAFKTGGMVTDPTPAVLGEGGPEKALPSLEDQIRRIGIAPEQKASMEAALQRAKPQARMYSTAGMKEALEENERMRPRDIKRKQKSVERLTGRLSNLKNVQLKRALENKGNFSKRQQESRLRSIRKRIEETESKLEQEKFELEELTRTDSPSGIGADATEIREDVNPYADRDRSKISARHMLDMSPEDFKEKVVDKNPIMQLGIERMAKNATRLNPSDDEKVYSPEDLKQEPKSSTPESPTPNLLKFAGMMSRTPINAAGMKKIRNEILKAGGRDEEGNLVGTKIPPFQKPAEISKIQEQMREKADTQKNNETMMKETMARVDEKVGKAVSEGPQMIPIPTGNMSRTQNSGGSSQIVSGDSSFKVASKDNMSHPIWRTRLG